MAADPSYFSKGVVASLAMVSGGTCYWPEPRCLVPVTVDIGGDMVLNVEIAHIRGAHMNGPRYVPDMTDAERRLFGNLLLMCPSHHRVIDVLHTGDYSIEKLEDWKRTREADRFDILRSLPTLDEDALQASFTRALREQAAELRQQVDRFEQALKQLARIDLDAARLLNARMKAAEKFQDAARRLEHTQYTAVLLESAAERLTHTQDTADLLLGVTYGIGGLSGLEDTADLLMSAAEALQQALGNVGAVSDLVEELDGAMSQRIQELREML